jgi:hypothetical protein
MITTPTVSGKPGQAPMGLSCDLYPLIGSHSTWTDPRGPVTGSTAASSNSRAQARGLLESGSLRSLPHHDTSSHGSVSLLLAPSEVMYVPKVSNVSLAWYRSIPNRGVHDAETTA